MSVDDWFVARERLSHGFLARWLVSLSAHRESAPGWDRPYAQRLMEEREALVEWLEAAPRALSPVSWAPDLWSPALPGPARKALEVFLEAHFRALSPLPSLLRKAREALAATVNASERCLQARPAPSPSELLALEDAVLAFRDAVSVLPHDRPDVLNGMRP